MARTKASVGSKVASGKSSKARCSAAPPPRSTIASGSTEKSSRSSGGGNPVCPRETPQWQKPITTFFICKDLNKNGNDCNGKDGDSQDEVAKSSKSKRNIIESDSEEELEKPKNNVLDETIELEPLNGDDSHKIEEYYPKNGGKGKGVGKKSKGKENRVVEKRMREDDETEVSKRVKVSDD